MSSAASYWVVGYETAAKCQTLQAAGWLDAIQAPVEKAAKRQTLQAAG